MDMILPKCNAALACMSAIMCIDEVAILVIVILPGQKMPVKQHSTHLSSITCELKNWYGHML